MGAAEILLVRHGATEWSATGRHTGGTDIPLSADGSAAALALRDRMPAHPDLVLVSPRQRAVETCRLAGLATGAQVDDDLREWDYGDYEGLTTPEIRATRTNRRASGRLRFRGIVLTASGSTLTPGSSSAAGPTAAADRTAGPSTAS